MSALANLFAFARFVWLFARFLAWQDHEQPGRDHTELAGKIAHVAFVRTTLDPEIVGAWLTATTEGESSFGVHRIGDHHTSFGVAQIHGRPDLENDDLANLFEAERQIEISFEMCGDFRPYFSGVCSHDKRVMWLSDQRMKKTRELLHMFDARDEVAVRP